MSEKIQEALKKYSEMFGDHFPTFELLRGLNEDESLKLINECIEKKKDVYELGYLEDDMDVLY